MIGGNITALVQVKNKGEKNAIGEQLHNWNTVVEVLGWLDYSGGQNDMSKYDAKVQETTHMFLCDFQSFKNLTNGVIQSQDEKIDATSENARMVIDGNVYNILLIDDPMNLHQHLEVYLKYVGGGLGV